MEPTTLIPELDHEITSTRRMLEALPEEDLVYRPHKKSWTTQELATHIANILGWVRPTLEHEELDLSGFSPGEALETKAAILAQFETTAADARLALEETDAATLDETWTLRTGEEVHFSMPKQAVYRFFVMNHLIHHRGQLAVHLRATGRVVPGMYGPSADENF